MQHNNNKKTIKYRKRNEIVLENEEKERKKKDSLYRETQSNYSILSKITGTDDNIIFRVFLLLFYALCSRSFSAAS